MSYRLTDRELLRRAAMLLCGSHPDVARELTALSTGAQSTAAPDIDKVAEAIRQADGAFWKEEPHFNLAMARVYARAAMEALTTPACVTSLGELPVEIDTTPLVGQGGGV